MSGQPPGRTGQARRTGVQGAAAAKAESEQDSGPTPSSSPGAASASAPGSGAKGVSASKPCAAAVQDQPLSDEDAYRLVFHTTGVGIFKSTPDGRYLMVNPAMAELLGFESVEAMLQVDVKDLYADPRRRHQFKRLVARDGRVRNFVIEAQRIDGERIWVSETATLVRDAEGRPDYYIGTIVEITREIEALQALVAAERDYREIFEHATIGIYRSSPDGKQLRANPALVRLNGYETEQEMLAAVNDIATEWYVDPDRRNQFIELLAREGRVEGFISEIYRHKTRERIWITESSRLVRDQDGQPLYYEGTVQDITEQIRASDELLQTRAEAEAASRAKSAFLANMSHELRTPLNAIIGFAEVMESEIFGALGSPRYRDYLGDIHSSGLHLLQLLDDILDLSKVEAGKLELEEDGCDLPAIFREAGRMLKTLSEQRGVAVTIEAADSLPEVRGDVRRLRQVALNLISNSVKYNRSGGDVRVTLTVGPGGDLQIAVADNGIGIAPEDLERVFEPFTQLNRAQSRRQEGTGLGLALCRQLIELHGGRLTLDSRRGEGTTVTITLPAARCQTSVPS